MEPMEPMERYARHLQGMIRIPTVSGADAGKTDFSRFDALHAYLAETYPNVHRALTREIVGRAGLLYKWEGKASGKLPVLLMAHQDVVPEGDPAKWTHPPYAAEIADGCVWGRGSTDCKEILMAEMEAVEALIEEGFVPDYDLYLAYGCNEEVQAPVKSAQEIVETLRARGVRLGCVFDEGGGVRAGADGVLVCKVALAEKASQDYEIFCDRAGGHSMEPGGGTALGAVARAAAAIEDHPFPYRLTLLTERQLMATARTLTGRAAEIYADPRGRWEELCALAREDRKLDALLHTTCAVTMAEASRQSNVLPAHASMTVNCRLLEGDTAEGLLRHFRALLPDGVCVRQLNGMDPEPAGRTDGPLLPMIGEAVRAATGKETLVIPSLLAGGTDAKYYSPICDQVFRFGGFLMDERWGAAHGIDEKIPCDALETGVRFFRELLLRY